MPASVFTYREIRAGVLSLLKREGVQDKCEAWRTRFHERERERHLLPSNESSMCDVQDGQLWRDMQHWPPRDQQSRVHLPGW